MTFSLAIYPVTEFGADICKVTAPKLVTLPSRNARLAVQAARARTRVDDNGCLGGKPTNVVELRKDDAPQSRWVEAGHSNADGHSWRVKKRQYEGKLELDGDVLEGVAAPPPTPTATQKRVLDLLTEGVMPQAKVGALLYPTRGEGQRTLTAVGILGKMRKKGWVEHVAYKGWRLTAAGRAL